jgi:hypothetical protein
MHNNVEREVTDRQKVVTICRGLAFWLCDPCIDLVLEYVEECSEDWFHTCIDFPLEEYPLQFECNDYQRIEVYSGTLKIVNHLNDAKSYTLDLNGKNMGLIVQNHVPFCFVEENERIRSLTPDINLFANTRMYTNHSASLIRHAQG